MNIYITGLAQAMRWSTSSACSTMAPLTLTPPDGRRRLRLGREAA